MSKTINIDIPYLTRDGKEKIKTVTIKRIFQWVNREWSELLDTANQVQKQYDQIQEIEIQKRDLLRLEPLPDNWYEQHRALDKKQETLADKIRGASNDDFFKKRFELSKGIFKDNQITDPDLFNFDFWERQVEPQHQMAFLSKAIYKDVERGGNKQKGKK